MNTTIKTIAAVAAVAVTMTASAGYETYTDKYSGYTWDSGSMYVGTFFDNNKRDMGTILHNSGSVFTGTYYDNADAKTGTQVYSLDGKYAGHVFTGTFCKGGDRGPMKGIYKFSDGNVQSGSWKCYGTGKFTGTKVYKDGSVTKYINDKAQY